MDWKTEGVMDGKNSDEEDDVPACVLRKEWHEFVISRLAKFLMKMIQRVSDV